MSTRERINSYNSYKELRDNAQRDISSQWQATISAVTNFIEREVETIAVSHDEWLQVYLRPVIDAARAAHPRRWYEKTAFSGACILLAFALSGYVGFVRHSWIAILGVTFLCALIPPILYKRRYEPKRIIRGIKLGPVSKGAKLQGLSAETSWVSEEGAAAGLSFIAGNLGAIFLGPIAGLVGGVLGSFVGWLVGESLGSRKEKLYASVGERIVEMFPQIAAELETRLRDCEATMIGLMQANFRRNVSTVKLLWKN